MTAVPDRLDAIQAQLDAATEGPWDWNTHDRSGARWSLEGDGQGVLTCAAMLWPDDSDAAFIAAAPENTRYLLDLARKQQAAIDALLFVADNRADLNKPVGRWWSEVIKGTIKQHMEDKP